MLDIVGKRYWYFLLSLLVIVPGVIFMIINWQRAGSPLLLGIDFTGGSLLQLQFKDAAPQPGAVKAVLDQHGFGDALVQTGRSRPDVSSDDTISIRTKTMDQPTKNAIETDLRGRFGDFTELRFESVGPSVGAEVSQRAFLAVLLASIGILAYISFAFRQVPNAFRYGACAIIAMLHDVLVVVGMGAIFGYFFGWEVDALFLTALLTVIGFSVHDTIVVFDRIRENMLRFRGEPFERVVNHSIIQTLDRSINTSLTVIFSLTALTLFGGATIKSFVVFLLIGIVSGTYSSIFNAAPLLVVWHNGEVRRLLGRTRGQAVTA